MSWDFNAEMHARPSIYFDGPAFVEHIALMPQSTWIAAHSHILAHNLFENDADVRTQVEFHTEFVTVTRLTKRSLDAGKWPAPTLSVEEAEALADVSGCKLVCHVNILVEDPVQGDLAPWLASIGFQDATASMVGGGAAAVCSDFRVGDDQVSRIILLNSELNAYRLGRMVRRIYEIETYRSMALLALPEARRLAPQIRDFDAKLVQLTNENLISTEHKGLLDEISLLSAHVISAAAQTRNRFGATAAYAKIVEERILELREAHVPGFQRFGIFVARRFKPAMRTCEATALRLEQLSHATMHLLDLLQTRIQVEIEYQNATQIRAVAERAATQVRIQRAVEGFSIIAISYYLLSLLKVVFETVEHAGYHMNPLVMLVSIPVVIVAVGLAIMRVKHALVTAE